MQHLTLRIHGLICETIFDLLRARLNASDGIDQVRIDLRMRELQLRLNDDLCTPAQLLTMIHKVGLQADPKEPDHAIFPPVSRESATGAESSPARPG